jgi:transposase
MSLQPHQLQEVAEETERVAGAAFPKETTFMKMRDERGVRYEDEDFAALFPAVGQPAETPWRLALVWVMQLMENLTERQAAAAVRRRIDWKYALCLGLTDSGFDFSVLSEFRRRLLLTALDRADAADRRGALASVVVLRPVASQQDEWPEERLRWRNKDD